MAMSAERKKRKSMKYSSGMMAGVGSYGPGK
jgi:hypothetical protein